MFHVNEIIKNADTGVRYRIIAITDGTATLCELDTEKISLMKFPCSALALALENGDYRKTDEPPSPVFDAEMLTGGVREDYDKKLACMKEVEDAYGPDFMGLSGKAQKPEAKKIMEKYGFERRAFHRLVSRYLQSGRKAYSLVDGRALVLERGQYQYGDKPGRKPSDGLPQGKLLTDEDYAHFDDAIRYMKTGHNISMPKAFTYMNDLYYSTAAEAGDTVNYGLLPENERPTFWQFKHYAEKVLSKKDKAVMHTSEREFRNDNRPLTSRSGYRVHGPGDMAEIDACEVKISLRDDREQSVSRPTVYFMVDVYSSVILAMSVALNVNSWVGLSNLFINLCEDKQKYCAKYGLGFSDPSAWPSGIRPRRVRMDRGSDMKSKAMQRVCNRFDIEMQNVTGGTGSEKGVVERSFHQLESELDAHFVKCGLIEKRYDSDHHRESTLEVSDYTKAVIAFVLEHNRMYFETYDSTPEMIEEGVRPIPAELWQYGVRKYGEPDPIPDPEQFFFDLLTPAKAKVTRRGIVWKGRYYMADDDPKLLAEMIDAGGGSLPFQIKYDPRGVDLVYYVRDGRLVTAPLNERMPGNAGLKGKTIEQCEDLAAKKRAMDKQGRRQNEETRAYTTAVLNTIVDEAKDRKTAYSDTKNIKEARAAEKARVESDYSIADRIEGLKNEALPDKGNILPNRAAAEIRALSEPGCNEADQSGAEDYSPVEDAFWEMMKERDDEDGED